jgi:hypothetical protein
MNYMTQWKTISKGTLKHTNDTGKHAQTKPTTKHNLNVYNKLVMHRSWNFKTLYIVIFGHKEFLYILLM